MKAGLAVALAAVCCLSAACANPGTRAIRDTEDPSAEVRERAVRTLGTLHESRALPVLVRALDDKDTRVGVAAAESIGAIGDPGAVEALATALERGFARQFDSRTSGGSDANAPHPTVLKAVATALGLLGGERAIATLVHVMYAVGEPSPGDRQPSVNIRGAVEEAAARIGSPAIPSLVEALRDPKLTPNQHAARALAGIQDPRAVDALVSALVAEADNRQSSLQYIQLETALGRAPVSVAGGRVRALLADPRARVRASACSILAAQKDSDAVDDIIAALTDRDSTVQAAAATALGKLGDPKAVPALKAVMGRPDAAPRMRRIGPDTFVDRRGEDARWLAAEALVKLGPAGSDALLTGLVKGPPYVAARAVYAFRQTKEARVADALIACFGRGDDFLFDAVEGLKGIGEPAVDSLLAAAGSSDEALRRGAIMALGGIRTPRAAGVIVQALHDSDLLVRYAAADAATEVSDPAIDRALRDALDRKDLETVANAIEYYIRKGFPGSEPTLIAALENGHNLIVGEAFLNSGNSILSDAARRWAKANGYNIQPSAFARGTSWGGSR